MPDAAPPLVPPPAARRPWPTGAAMLVLTAAVLLTFGRLFASEFSWWDDQETIHQNALLNPPTLATFRYFWQQPFMGLYVPVTYTLWATIAKVAYVGVPDEFNIALNPLLFHATNVALHVGSTALVFAILRRLLAAPTPALLGALLFAVHPMQVESLAWISGMKDLLCWFGTLAVVLIYVRRVQAIRSTGRPLWASGAMPAATLVLALAILSKPTAIVAPAALLAIDGLVLRRRWLRSLAELSPLLAMSAVGAGVARVAQFVGNQESVPLLRRPFIVGDAFLFYAGKFAWPFSLGVDYGRTPSVVLGDGWAYARWIVPAAAAAWLVARRRARPWLALAGALVAIGIAPVSGVATFQMQQFSTTADHYVYFSMLGPALALAWALRQWPARGLRVAAVVVLVALAARSFDQCRHWRDTFALFEQAMRVNPRSLAAHNNLAAVQLRRQVPQLDDAERHARLAVEIDPEDYYALETFGIVEGMLGNVGESSDAFEKLWGLCQRYRVVGEPLIDVSRSAFGSMVAAGDYERAAVWARRSVEAMPGDYQARSDLSFAVRMVETQRAATRPAR